MSVGGGYEFVDGSFVAAFSGFDDPAISVEFADELFGRVFGYFEGKFYFIAEGCVVHGSIFEYGFEEFFTVVG